MDAYRDVFSESMSFETHENASGTWLFDTNASTLSGRLRYSGMQLTASIE
jgi:hypothetical protein